ncbi:MAG: hypothetical protein KatS3mg108_0393 [Isosphaeraceae bacterium]|nr:MAG: hypothetical protein KatS3mg108_0393 [Isosphaeraceae bacterium]
MRTDGLRPLGEGWYQGRGGLAFAEYALGPVEGRALGLRLGVSLPDGPMTKLPPVEVWWSGSDGSWSETRRVTWRPPAGAGAATAVVPLEVMPHWGDPAAARRLRVAVRMPGRVGIEAPRLVR